MITGGTGYIGSLFHDFLTRGVGVPQVRAPGSRDLDVTDMDAVAKAIRDIRPQVILHLAAKADTDWCEAHFPEALRVNVQGSLNVVRIGLDAGATVVYFSSGCLYPTNHKAHAENDEMKALCRYTETKLQAEAAVRPYADEILNIRMRQPFSNHRNPRNLLEKLARYRQWIDEPNSMSHLEECIPIIWALSLRNVKGPLNMTNSGWTTPYRIAQLIERHCRPGMVVERIGYEELLRSLKAVRVNSLVDCGRLASLGYRLMSVEEAIVDALTHPCNLGEYSWRDIA